MMDDLKIREFKNNIINYMNHTDLPLEVKRLVLSEILHETTQIVNNDITALINNLKKEKEETKTDPENSPE
jgi:hypothetical protein